MVSFDELLAGTCDLLGINPAEVGTTRFQVLRRAISSAIQFAWTYNWWPGTVVRRHMIPGIVYPGPLWRGVLTYFHDSGRWYQYLDSQYRDEPPAVQDTGGIWRANLPYWAEYTLDCERWSATSDYTAGTRVRHGGMAYIARENVSAGNAPGGTGSESAKWVPVPFPAPFVYVHQAPYPPVGRVRGLWRSSHRGWEDMLWSDITDGALLFVMGREDEQYGWRVYDDLANPSDYANAVLEYQWRFPDLVGTVYDNTRSYRPPHWPLLPNAPLPPVATPTFSPSSGSFSDSVEVSINTVTPGATIHYTLDGSAPTEASPIYTTPITLTTTTTIKAMAVKSGMSNSAVASKTYSKARLVYWGASSNPVLDEAGILALPYQVYRPTPAGSYTFPDNAPPKYLFMAWPDDGSQPVATTGFTSGGIPMTGDFAGAAEGYDQTHNGWPYKIVTVNGKPHRLYRTLYQMELSVTIVVST